MKIERQRQRDRDRELEWSERQYRNILGMPRRYKIQLFTPIRNRRRIEKQRQRHTTHIHTNKERDREMKQTKKILNDVLFY